MSRWVLVGLAAAATLPAYAGIRGPTRKVNALTIDGRPYGGGRSWAVDLPTLRAPSGYLAYDASGKSPKVTFRGEKGPGTSWRFVGVKYFTRYEPVRASVSEEQTGYTMKVRAAEGPFKGWYLARVGGSLVLVKDPGKAATLEMLETTVEIKSR